MKQMNPKETRTLFEIQEQLFYLGAAMSHYYDDGELLMDTKVWDHITERTCKMAICLEHLIGQMSEDRLKQVRSHFTKSRP